MQIQNFLNIITLIFNPLSEYYNNVISPLQSLAHIKLEYFNKNDSQFYEKQRNYSLYYTYRKINSLYEKRSKILQNLNDVLRIYSGCLIHLINYDGIDIIKPVYPIVLSRYDVVKSTYHVKSKVLRGLKNLLISERNRYYKFEKVPNLNKSISWCQRHHVDMECLTQEDANEFQLRDNSLSHKPWQCEAHLYLFPPDDLNFYKSLNDVNKIGLLIPPSFTKLFWILSLKMLDDLADRRRVASNVLLITRPRYDILFTEKDDVTRLKTQAWATSLISHPNNPNSIYSTPMQKLLTAEIGTTLILRTPHLVFINVLVLRTLCRHCQHQKSLIYTESLYIEKDPDSVRTVINTDSIETLMCKLFTSESVIQGFVRLGERLPTLENLHSIRKMFSDKSIHINDVRWELEAGLLGSVFQNVTFLSHPFACSENDGLVCENDLIPLVVIVTGGKEDNIHFQLHKRALKFVSCGDPEMLGLVFGELISVFDIYIWILLLITLCTISVFTSIISLYGKSLFRTNQIQINLCSSFSSQYLIPSIVSYIRILVEQGDPIQNRLWNAPFIRCTFICFLFVATVISNAYKNENITRITLPRDVVPYDTFDSLTRNNFTIYTRAVLLGGYTHFGIRGLPSLVEKLIMNLNVFKHEMSGHELSFLFKSEVYTFAHVENSQTRLNPSIEDFSNMSKYIMNHSKIIPHWWDIYYDSRGECDIFSEKSYCNPLRNCSNQALILPELDAYRKYFEMKQKGYLFLYRSKENLLASQFGIVFHRWIPPEILQRMQGLYSSGLMDYWDNFVSEFLTRIRVGFFQETKEPKASNLEGNIVVVFVIIPCGLALSCVSILVEAWKNPKVRLMKRIKGMPHLLHTGILRYYSNIGRLSKSV